MKQATLCYLIKGNEILLGLKKRGFGKDKWNGYGGKALENETPEEANVREIKEEMGVSLSLSHLKKVAEIDFFFVNPEWNQKVYVFFAEKWKGEPKETEEMMPRWFAIDDFPLNQMWKDDPYWLPFALKGKKIKASFSFGENNEDIVEKKVEFVKGF